MLVNWAHGSAVESRGGCHLHPESGFGLLFHAHSNQRFHPPPQVGELVSNMSGRVNDCLVHQ